MAHQVDTSLAGLVLGQNVGKRIDISSRMTDDDNRCAVQVIFIEPAGPTKIASVFPSYLNQPLIADLPQSTQQTTGMRWLKHLRLVAQLGAFCSPPCGYFFFSRLASNAES